MRTRNCYRLASVVLALFALGHTVGFLRFRPPTAEGVAVWNAMNTVHFKVGSSDLTYGGFYVGFGLFVSAYLAFSSLLAWQLGRLADKRRDDFLAIEWGFIAVQVANIVLCAVYFGPVQVAFAMVVVALLASGAWRRSPGQVLRSMNVEPA